MTVKVGLVGSSWWVDSMYLPALQNHPDAEVVAICGRDAARAQAMAAQWKIPQIYTNYEELIAKAGLDALIIASGNESHYPISMAAMKAGLHLLCEKPLALTYPEAKTMADFAEAQNLITMTPFTYRFMPTNRYIKELVESGYIGKPYHLNLRYYTGFGRTNEYRWRFDKNRSGSGVIGDIGSHFLYLASWWFGEIVEVSCVTNCTLERSPAPDGKPYEQTEDTAILTLTFANGAQGVIHVTCMAYEDTPFGQTHHVELHGSGGTLYGFIDWDTVQEVRGARVGEGMIKPLPVPEHIWGNARRDTVHNTYRDIFRQQDHMTRGFITAVAKGERVEPDFAAGAEIQRLIEAALRSDVERRRVKLEEIAG